MNPDRHSVGVALLAETLRRQGTVRFRVRGCSMRPLVRDGDVVEVCRQSARELKRGDLAVFSRGGAILVHRVLQSRIAGNKWRVVTKGDAFSHPDAPLRAGELLGRVARIQRGPRVVSLESLPQRLLHRLALAASANSRYWFVPAQRARRVLRKLTG